MSGHDFSRAKKGNKNWALAPAGEQARLVNIYETRSGISTVSVMRVLESALHSILDENVEVIPER